MPKSRKRDVDTKRKSPIARKAERSAKKDRLAAVTDEVEHLHPLLDNLLRKLPNIIDVEYTHGKDEMGADFLLSKRHDTFGNTQYVGVIAKVGKVVQGFSDIQRQIEECDIPRTFFGGKEKVRIDEIWVVLTEHITQGAQDKIHEKFRKITFIEGGRLEKLIDTYLPAYWNNVSLEVGEYLTTLRARNQEIDRSISLLQVSDEDLYIEQDIYEVPSSEYSEKQQRRIRNSKADVYNVIGKHNLILIEGGMGAGKSKLIRRLVNHFTTAEVYVEKKIIPVPVTYKDLLDKFNNDIDRLINDRIGLKMKDELSDDTKYLLLIDGIDEKNTPVEEQVEILKVFADKVNRLPNVKAILTSRYLRALGQAESLDCELSRFELRPLSFQKTIEFLTKICTQLSITNRIIEDLKKSQLFKELPKSPIAAILLAKLINDNSKDLPSNMTELYAKYIELMLGRWDIDKGLQSQKEYQALDNILMDLSRYMLENEISSVSLGDAKQKFRDYLQTRNLGIDADALFDKMIERCEIVMLDLCRGTIAFKHRTFTEFFYAKSLIRDGNLQVDQRAFQIYWMNTFFFYLGLKKDCPEILRELVTLDTTSEFEKWNKVVNMGNYFLAAYTSPYGVVSDGITSIMAEAAQLYKDVTAVNSQSAFATLPRIHILYLFQLLIRDHYSYEYFKKAFEDAALGIATGKQDDDLKAYALFFLNVAYIDMGAEASFDFLLKAHPSDLPLDLQLAVRYESKNLKEQSALMKKQDKHLKNLMKGNQALALKIEGLFRKPIRSLR